MKITVIIICLTLSGCAFIKLQQNLNEMEKSITLSGKVTAPLKDRNNIVVVIYKNSERGKEIVDFQQIDDSGYYLFVVPWGKEYFLAAFDDSNGNSIYDPGEPLGNYGKPSGVFTSTEVSNQSLNIRLFPYSHYPNGLPRDLNGASIIGNKNIPIVLGEITTLKDKRFSRRKAKQALWTPLDFAKENGIGVFFLEAYDPEKIPVIFVHGAGGSPSDWSALIKNIDRQCYQPWLFYYPTGVRLSKSTKLLVGVVDYLQQQYGFKELVITAHSIGGLIARSFIVKTFAAGKPNYVKTLVTISTPWNGHGGARHGVEYAPAVIPLWIDLQPNSQYIKSVFKYAINTELDYYLLFSFYTGNSVFGQATDGTVAVSSQLDYRAQQEASRIYGIDSNHSKVLRDAKTVDIFNQILASSPKLNKNNVNISCR